MYDDYRAKYIILYQISECSSLAKSAAAPPLYPGFQQQEGAFYQLLAEGKTFNCFSLSRPLGLLACGLGTLIEFKLDRVAKVVTELPRGTYAHLQIPSIAFVRSHNYWNRHAIFKHF